MIEIHDINEVESFIDELQVIIFDLDDTLYSEKEYIRSGYKKIAQYFNRPELEEMMWNVFKMGGKAIDETFDKCGLSEYKGRALEIYRYQKPDIHPYPGVIDLISRIRKSKNVGIITDGRPEGQRAKIEALHIMVDYIIITDELGGLQYRKPNETAFIMMKNQFNVPFEKMVYVGDNIHKDFVAPQKLGMKTIRLINADGLYS